MEVPQETTDLISDMAMADLNPSFPVVFGKVGVSMMVGGALSMMVCGQFGLAGSSFANQLNHYFHGMGPLACALFCGSLFSVVPLVILRLSSNPLQFKAVIGRRYYAAMIWLAAFGGVFAYHGEFNNDLVSVGTWFVAALAVFELGGLALQSAEGLVQGLFRRSSLN